MDWFWEVSHSFLSLISRLQERFLFVAWIERRQAMEAMWDFWGHVMPLAGHGITWHNNEQTRCTNSDKRAMREPPRGDDLGLVPSPSPITEHSAHVRPWISARKNWGVKGVDRSWSLLCKWMNHFKKKHEAGGLDACQSLIRRELAL